MPSRIELNEILLLSETQLKTRLMSLYDNPANGCYCHSEPFGKFKIKSAKNLIDSGIYTFEILRLPVQNEVVGQVPNGSFGVPWHGDCFSSP